MTDSASEFSFIDRLEGYCSAIRELGADEFREVQQWTSTNENRGLRIRGEDGTVLVATKGTTVSVRFQKEMSGEWVIISPSHGQCEIDGIGVAGHVRVRIEVTADVLECMESPSQGAGSVPFIEVGHHGVVRDFAGLCQLGTLGGQLICKRGSRSERPGRITTLGDHSGGKLVGVDVTQLPSRPHFDQVAKLSVFAPDVESLYDLACPYDRIASRLRQWRRGELFDPSGDTLSTPRERAHWFRDLYNAMGSNAVPASTRSAVRWCYALLEHESIKPRRTPSRGTSARWRRRLFSREAVESIGRWLHRCVGYGQRPSRALACWLIATTSVTIWSAQHRALEDGAAGWLQRGAEVLLSPLRVLRLGYDSTPALLGGPALDAVAYLVVGLPFLFFVMSLREFFRSPLSRRPSTP